MACSVGVSASNGSGVRKRKVGESFTIERVLAERGAYSRYLAYDHRAGETRLIELQRVEPREQTAWMARAETARRVRHRSLVRCLETRMLSDTQGLLVFEKPDQELAPKQFEPMEVAKFGLSLASLLGLLHRVGFGFHVPLVHCAYWHKRQGGLDVRVEALSRAIGGFYRESFCARCQPDLPPELAKGDPPSEVGDQFILGAFLYRLLKGKPIQAGGLEHLRPAQNGLESLLIQLVQSDPGRRPLSAVTVCRSFMNMLRDSGGDIEVPPFFGWLEPKILRPSPRALARSFVVPGLSQAAVERLASEDQDIAGLASRITQEIWGSHSDKEGRDGFLEELRCLAREGKVTEAMKKAESLGGVEAARIWARLVWRSSSSRGDERSSIHLDEGAVRLLEAIRLRQKGRLRQAEEKLAHSSIRGFDRWHELARLAAVAGNGEPAVEAWRRAVSEADAAVDEARARAGLGEQLARMGRLREGKEEISLAMELLSGGEQKMVLRELMLGDATVDFLTGRWLRARDTLELLVAECGELGDAWLRQQSLMKLAELDLKTGGLAEAQSHITEALRVADLRGDLHGRLSCLLLEIESHVVRKGWCEALKKAKNLKRLLADIPFGRLRLQTSLELARAAVECGKLELAEGALAEVRTQIRPLGEPAMEARCDGVNGLYLARRGRSREAVLVFEKAIEMLEGTSQPCLLAELYRDFVLTCAGFAPDDQVALRRQAARRTASDLGAQPLLRALDGESSIEERASTPMASGFIATSPIMHTVLEKVEQAARFDVPIHLRGESGTGKELVARAIHDRGPRSGKKMIAVNCAALPDSLLEAELFGHVRGAFTGADRARVGLFEEAHGGTLFLDEVADLSTRGQTTLLRVLQDKQFRRLGDSAVRCSRFRLISASHKRLEEEVAEGRFREDLFFRLKVVEIEIPPLRERREDILPLVKHYLGVKSAQLGLHKPSLALEVEKALLAYSWPGNVRELENEMIQALLRLGKASRLDTAHLSPSLRGKTQSPLRFASQDFEMRFLRDALARHGGNRTRAARSLGVTRQALYKKLRKYGMGLCQTG